MRTLLFYNPRLFARHAAFSPSRKPLAFHRRLPGYEPTPLVDAPALARKLGVGQVWVKDESQRFDMSAFKILGASWAIYQALGERLGGRIPPWTTFEELVAHLAPLRPLTLVAATEGNHGRAVARMAALLGFAARIYVPATIAPTRMQAIESEGAAVTIVDGSYDDAVARAAAELDEGCLLVSDTAWPGYEGLPRWVIDGYSTMFWEIEDQLRERGQGAPDIVVVQIGVGALAAAVVRHYRRIGAPPETKIVGVEPASAACMLASLHTGRVVEMPGPHGSNMAGLNCGIPSAVAWPIVSAGVDLCVAIGDERARQGVRDLARDGIIASETGAAGVGGLIELLAGPRSVSMHDFLNVDRSTRVLVLATEGASNPAAYRRTLGQRLAEMPPRLPALV